jgi:hypothetical protein
VCFDDEIHSYQDLRLTSFSKEKGKKESLHSLWRVSKKQVYGMKYYPA